MTEAFGADPADVSQNILVGRPATKIIGYARSAGIDLIVVGATGHTGVERLLLGSVTENIVRQSGVPVLTVP